MREELNAVLSERRRIQVEYQQRANEIKSDLYAPWQPAQVFLTTVRKAVAARMLKEAQVFPRIDHRCLEVGCGTGGWLADLISWGVREPDLHGIDINALRISRAKEILPAADLRIGDATELPWDSCTFNLVISSTLFTSVLDPGVRRLIAREIVRVLAPGGALLWYDFAFNNPKNRHVRGISSSEVRKLFPQLAGKIRSVTLAPPLARLIVPASWTLASLLEAVPFLRTHLLAALIKSVSGGEH
jgi:ubiquinone/menaquinone biosynthesis C-methylase UbiE